MSISVVKKHEFRVKQVQTRMSRVMRGMDSPFLQQETTGDFLI